MRPVIIQLKTQLEIMRNGMRPAPEDVSAAGLAFTARRNIYVAAVKIALQSKIILRAGLIINAESALSHPPRICSIISIGKHLITTIKIFAIDAVINIRCQRAAVTHPREILQPCSTARLDVKPLRVFGALARDVDHAIDGIPAPNRSALTADDFVPLNVL